jgi:hypothetical protein
MSLGRPVTTGITATGGLPLPNLCQLAQHSDECNNAQSPLSPRLVAPLSPLLLKSTALCSDSASPPLTTNATATAHHHHPPHLPFKLPAPLCRRARPASSSSANAALPPSSVPTGVPVRGGSYVLCAPSASSCCAPCSAAAFREWGRLHHRGKAPAGRASKDTAHCTLQSSSRQLRRMAVLLEVDGRSGRPTRLGVRQPSAPHLLGANIAQSSCSLRGS